MPSEARMRAAIARAERIRKIFSTHPRRDRVDLMLADSCETGVCVQCGHSHRAESRRSLIRRIAHLSPTEIAELWPCFYGDYRNDKSVERKLHRDMNAARDVR